ncbi:MAG: hypothetical protein JJE09_14175 [Bacteroidia bacterium]|nr:hypothetical protein [Bacteroidia bacterium]
MIANVRQQFNQQFTEKKYQDFLADLDHSFQHKIPFRVAESPLFIDSAFKKKLLRASNDIIDFIVRDDFKEITKRAIPKHLIVPNETNQSLFLALDYAVVKNENGELSPQLIEMQGFPSLFGWQDFLASKFREHFTIAKDFEQHFDLTSEQYQHKLKVALLNGHDPENVILLEIDPLKQNTTIDFLITEKITGIAPVHIGDVMREGKKLYYNKSGKKIRIQRIYNRVIFDELTNLKDSNFQFNLTEDAEVEWAGHPNWFFRISKYTMPFIKSEFIPECKFLSEYDQFPSDLENYVLKPLYSFSGSGVFFHVTQKEIDNIPAHQRQDFLLQRKVHYEPVVQAPDGMVKAEVRILFLWEDGAKRPIPVTNLARLSRGDMIGVKYNKDKTWVGGSICFFEK